jgi:CTP synthase
MVIEYARNVVGLEGASSTEFEPDTKYPVIATMAEQVEILASGDMGHTMRLGLFDAALTPGSVVAEAYGQTLVKERHRHRYEVNNSFRDQPVENSFSSATYPPDSYTRATEDST